MKILIFALFSFSTLASPLSQMKGRLGDYNQVMAPDHCAAAQSGTNFNSSDYGLLATLECEIQCKNGSVKRQRAASSFVPMAYDLYPGDGSSDSNTLWRSLAVTMKVWSEEVCLQEASDICAGLENVTDSNVTEVESGDWKMNHKLGCDEKVATLSPFDNTVNSKRLPAPLAMQMEIVSKSHSLPVFDQTFKLAKIKQIGECKNKMEADLCFGDCVHDMGDNQWKETLASPEPLGRAKDSFCMDGIVGTLRSQKSLSIEVRVKICEAFFWSSMMHSHASGSSCAALRGETRCRELVESLSKK